METDDLTPEGDPGFDETLEAPEESTPAPDRSPSQQRLHEEVRGRLFEGRAPRRSLEAGTLVAGRYRIAGLLGAGGMGEVFRARDLVLEEDVAIKLLPESRAHDEAFMRRFVNEVRLARQISHPSVCRVHDIGEVDGRAFLSMEYIDGEDLASLLRRIGRLPPEKGYELAQQLCAGLAELHGAGLLHRDLKPANLMIDGQGRLKLADFGLAAVREELRAHEYGDGTPAYMAPEQLSGREVSERSDLYSLGVVLYELLSGRHPHEAKGGPSGERGTIDRTAPAVTLGARVTGLADETLEIIDRCLETDPGARPGSVLEVAAALPGGDPIAAALRAGRAPSVEAVANASATAHLLPWQAWLLAAFTIVVLLAYAGVGPARTLWGQSGPALAPAVLEDRAHDVIAALGVTHPEGATMRRFVRDDRYLRGTERMELSEGRPVPVLFEYRASPGALARLGSFASAIDPPMRTPGELRVVLDVRGRLRLFERVPMPPSEDDVADAAVDWSPLLTQAGIVEPESVEAARVPGQPCDVSAAWKGRVADLERPVRVEAGSWRGQPVWFLAEPPWRQSIAPPSAESAVSVAVQRGIVLVFFTVLLLLARRMHKRGEVDGRGAVRVAIVLMLCVTASELLTSAVGQSNAIQTTLSALQEGLLVGAIALLGYAVVEPYGRRFFPGVMVSWVRLTRGRWRDPWVGRDLLVGLALGGVIGLIAVFRAEFLGAQAPYTVQLKALGGLGHATGAVIAALWLGAFGVMQIYILFLALRWVARRTTIAAVAFFVLWTAFELLRLGQDDVSVTGWVFAVVASATVAAILAYILTRRGLLTLSAAQVMLNLMLTLPLSLDFAGWYGTISVVAVGTLVAIVGWALYVALGAATPSERSTRTSRTRA